MTKRIYDLQDNAANHTVLDSGGGSHNGTATVNTSSLHSASGYSAPGLLGAFDSPANAATLSQLIAFSDVGPWSFGFAADISDPGSAYIFGDSGGVHSGNTAALFFGGLLKLRDDIAGEFIFSTNLDLVGRHHYVVTSDGTDLRLYIDGAFTEIRPDDALDMDAVYIDRLFSDGAGGGDEGFAGKILGFKFDDTTCWNDSQAATEYTRVTGLGVQPTGAGVGDGNEPWRGVGSGMWWLAQ